MISIRNFQATLLSLAALALGLGLIFATCTAFLSADEDDELAHAEGIAFMHSLHR